MIILRQKNYSTSSEKELTDLIKKEFPNVSNKLYFDIFGNFPTNIFKTILKTYGYSKIMDEIWEDEKKYAKEHGISKEEFSNGIQLETISYDEDFDNEICFVFAPISNSKVSKILSSSFFWSVDFSGKTGKFITVISGD